MTLLATPPAAPPVTDGRPDAAIETTAAHRRQRRLSIALMCGAVVCFAGVDTTAKLLARDGVAPLLTTFVRYAVGVALVSCALNPIRTPGVARTRRPGLQVVRSLLLFGTTACNFIAVRYLQLAETVSIQFAAPLAVALIAGPLLGEWSSRARLAAIAVGFVGVLVIVRPGTGTMHWAVLFSFGNVLCYALYVIATRRLAAFDSSATTMFYSGLAGLALMSPLLPWIWTPPTALAWLTLFGVGLFGTMAHWLLVLAHARAPANVLAPFLYTQILWSVLIGYLVFGDVPNLWTLAGAAVIVASGLALLAEDAARRRGARAGGRVPTGADGPPQR